MKELRRDLSYSLFPHRDRLLSLLFLPLSRRVVYLTNEGLTCCIEGVVCYQVLLVFLNIEKTKREVHMVIAHLSRLAVFLMRKRKPL